MALHEPLAPMVVATNEMRLIAPESLGELADEVARKAALATGEIERGVDTEFVFAPLREQLYQVMRADLDDQAVAVPGAWTRNRRGSMTIIIRPIGFGRAMALRQACRSNTRMGNDSSRHRNSRRALCCSRSQSAHG